MDDEFDRISDSLVQAFLKKYLPAGEKTAGPEVMERWTAELLADCKALCPDSVWDSISIAEFRDDTAAFLAFLKEPLEAGASRWQLTLSAVEDEQDPGVVYLFGGKRPKPFPSAFAQAVEAAVSDKPAATQEWARWYLLVGWLGLAAICVLHPYALTAKPIEDGVIYCVGIDDRTHLYLGVRSGALLCPMIEWN